MANLKCIGGTDKQSFPTPEQIEALTRELIAFCFQWGMWDSVAIYSNGKQYIADLGATDTQSPAVKVVPVEPEDYWTYLLEWYGAQGHILSISLDGPLIGVLHDFVYETEMSKLSPEGQARLLELDPGIREEAEDNLEEERDPLNALDFDSYEDYQELRDICSEREQKLAAELVRSHICYEGGPVVSYILQTFDEIFERYSLWYDFVDGSFLTCFVK